MKRHINKPRFTSGATRLRVAAFLLLAINPLSPDFGEWNVAAAGDKASAAQPKAPQKRVSVVRPHKGGIQRTTTQPGTIEAFNYADLYSKISGYLKKQPVDIGDPVKEGDVIAEIDAPEYQKELNQAEANLAKSRAQVTLMQAKVESAKADAEAATATVKQSEAELIHTKSSLAFREIQYERIKHLFELKSIEERLVDEKDEQRQAARGAVLTADAAILTAKALAAAAQARVAQAEAAVEDAKAGVQVAEANVSKAAVFVEYTRITSPYTGVVTRRSFHVGDFIRAAEGGGTTPLLSVARTDLMRVIVQVPERDAAYSNRGDPAVVELDALSGKKFHGKVARIADSEDRLTRSMRTEIDLKNSSGQFRDGMFGRVTIYLSDAATKGVTVPSSSLVRSGKGKKNSVFVVRDGNAHRQPVEAGRDDGIRAEILSGLSVDEFVVDTPGEDLAEGTPVETETLEGADHHRSKAGVKAALGGAAGRTP